MRREIMMAAALALPFASVPALADGHMEAAPEVANKDWYSVVYIDFKPGKTGEAMKLIKEFIAVDKALGRTPPMMMRMNSGPYDVMVVFPMRDGIAAMGWKDNPESDKWDAKLAERLGGEDKVKEHWDKYNALVASASSQIAHVDNDYMESI